jgi:5-methylcytosine-specific restriction endonuclease McrA
MFLNNKYTNYYNSIINRAKSRILPKEIYTERHHIIPKSLGGSNSKNNLVLLTAREHRLEHMLLTKMLIDPEHIKKMWYAA